MLLLQENKRLATLVMASTLLLFVPLVAMQFTDEVLWRLLDFAVAGILLFSTSIAVDVVLRKVTSKMLAIVACVGILLALALVWIELAVGLFGTPFAGS